MRTLISTAFISLDGVVEDPGGQADYPNGGWTFKSIDFVPDAYAPKGSEQQESTAMLLGRRSYELFAPVWPGMEDFNHYKDPPKYVVSTTLADAGLIDRYNLLVFPLLLRAGQKLFSDTDKDTQKLRLVDSEIYSNGIQKNIFDVIH